MGFIAHFILRDLGTDALQRLSICRNPCMSLLRCWWGQSPLTLGKKRVQWSFWGCAWLGHCGRQWPGTR